MVESSMSVEVVAPTDVDLSGYLPLTGGAMTGPLVTITPAADGDAANKGYVDTAIAAIVIPPGGGSSATIGDFKYGFQPADHGGWILLDGRPLSSLSVNQYAEADALGFVDTLPLADDAVAMQNGLPLGSISGAMAKTVTIAQANLPAVTLEASEASSLPATTSDAGEHFHEMQACTNDEGTVGFSELLTDYPQKVWRRPATIANVNNGNLLMAGMAMDPTGIHNHTVELPAHGHGVPLGGSGTPIDIDVTPKAISVNAFVYLGA